MMISLLERAARDGLPYKQEMRIVRPDGDVRIVDSRGAPQRDASGAVVQVLGTAHDVTRRRQAEATLQESERRLRALVGSLDDIVFEFDKDGTYLNIWANDEELLAQPRQQLLGRRVADVLGEEVGRPYQLAFERALTTGKPEAMEYSLQVGAGLRWFLASINPIPWPDGAFHTVSMLARDITERKSLEAQLRQAQKMEAVGVLAGGVAHDFNNVLTVILGLSELLLGSMPEPDERRATLQQVIDAGERAAGLTRQLLAFSRKQVLSPQVLNLNMVVSDMDRLLRRVIGEDIDLVTRLDAELGAVEADPSQLEQVIANLAVNARDAMPFGGRLTIETANVGTAPAEVSQGDEAPPGPYVMLSITDTGHGMAAETQTHAFEPFFTTKNVGDGTGLGLSTVYGIIRQTGGYVWLTSGPDQGTTFKIYLPQAKDRRGLTPPLPRQGRLARGSETILLVEDDAGVRNLASAVLRSIGYTVLDASRGTVALDVSAHYDGPIDLLLTDMVMPEMGGNETAEHLTAERPGLKVLCMSGFPGDAFLRQRTLETGAAFLQKPFTPAGLAQKVRETLDA